VQEARGVEVAGAGGVDQLRHHPGGHLDRGVPGDDDRAELGTRQGGDGSVTAHGLDRRVEVGAVQSGDLGLVGEQEVDVVGDQIQEVVAVAFDAEAVRQGHRDRPAGVVSDGGRPTEGLLRVGSIEQVALEVQHRSRRHDVCIDVVGSEEHRRPQIGVHRALSVGGDEDQAAPRRRPVGRGRGGVGDPGGDHVMGEHRPELIVSHPSDEMGAAAE